MSSKGSTLLLQSAYKLGGCLYKHSLSLPSQFMVPLQVCMQQPQIQWSSSGNSCHGEGGAAYVPSSSRLNAFQGDYLPQHGCMPSALAHSLLSTAQLQSISIEQDDDGI
ncbi:hypothetical protein DUNSADRAFT_9481 [Dunaliella salina]|uniref:Encoded protein n=1 Tax=Dunaliella salina TaxID=3046 RepID=A0ABQ7GHA5_DUNSA|nr:hypothetical protein DUNSADRAFT_9481 [Dunaliella salina]|eukprot:KAF5833996.1 hypothetical protein DUNSADRAFT_9481 [Dunaliella salina]